MIPLIVVLATITYGIVRALGRIWLDHRIRLALLDKLLEKPELIESYTEVQHVVVNAFDGASNRPHQDYALTGIILTAIGVASALLGHGGEAGRISVGLFVGGWICIALGLLLAVIGVFIHRLERNLVTLPKKGPSSKP
jgi:hypothetical protein